MDTWIIRALLLILPGAILVLVATSQPRAQSHHDPASPDHWYDADCCNLRDCRPISGVRANGEAWSEIIQTESGFEWHSSQSGKIHQIPASYRKIRPSRDGFYHGCETPGSGTFLCLYIPLFF